jgi:hypothetical protein
MEGTMMTSEVAKDTGLPARLRTFSASAALPVDPPAPFVISLSADPR